MSTHLTAGGEDGARVNQMRESPGLRFNVEKLSPQNFISSDKRVARYRRFSVPN